MPSGAKRYPYWMPYLGPYALFLVLTFVGGEILPDPYALYLYPVKILLVGGAVLWFLKTGAYPELTLSPSLLGIGAGVAGFALWVLPEKLLAPLSLGQSSYAPQGNAGLLAARLAGAVLVVPVFEELFLRSFLPRWIDRDEDFRAVPIGRFRFVSFAVVVLAAAVTHHRWLRAALYSALLNLVLAKEKRLSAVIWAHAVTNLLLGGYVLAFGKWGFW